MSNKDASFHSGCEIGTIYQDGETLIFDFYNRQYQVAASFIDEIVEHAEVTIDKGRYR